MSETMILDLETIPDFELIRTVGNYVSRFDDDTIYRDFVTQRVKAGKSEFLPPPYHQVVSAGIVYRDSSGLSSCAYGNGPTRTEITRFSEKSIIERVAQYFEREPNLVTFNGSGFDLSVLVYRAMKNKVSLGKLCWKGGRGRGGQDFKWNNYMARFHDRHIDLMDELALFNGGSKVSLNVQCNLVGIPGKLDTSGSQVLYLYKDGQYERIDKYVLDDCASTYGMFLHYLLTFGKISEDEFRIEFNRLLNICSDEWRQAYETRKT